MNSANPSDDKPIIRLACIVQPYSYGKKGSKSLAARYATATPENQFQIDEEQEYGEIWMGDHQNGPSKSAITGIPLRTLITDSPSTYLTDAVHKKLPGPNGSAQLPFLFKVLSFDKALPLQAHPDKSLAERLKKQELEEKGENEQFVDGNHKPEVAVALSPIFEAFVGFRPVEEIRMFIDEVEELREVIGEEAVHAFKTMNEKQLERELKKLFGKIFDTDKKTITRLTEKLTYRAKTEGDGALGGLGEKEQLAYVVDTIFSQYPHDAGLFAAIFFMNFIRLRPGEGVVIPADCIHAYLSGDCIECMANSDNMVSCGFQGEMGPADSSDLFVKMLLNNPGKSRHLLMQHEEFKGARNGFTTKYKAPMEEFNLLRIVLPNAAEEFIGIEGPAIYLVTKGDVEVSARPRMKSKLSREPSFGISAGTDTDGAIRVGKRRGSESQSNEMQKETLTEGQTVFVKPGYEVCFWSRGQGRASAEVYGAYCEVE